jgi:hypothetical protein
MTKPTKFIIQFDRRGKYGILVMTVSGIAMAYFSHMDYAVQYCNAYNA